MRGNVIGMHTYPVDFGDAEPAVWVGLPEQVNADGTVASATYPASWANTLRGGWGYVPQNTSDYAFGAAQLYEFDCFGHPIQSGHANLCPWPATAADQATLFNAVGMLWQKAFAFAHDINVQTILGQCARARAAASRLLVPAARLAVRARTPFPPPLTPLPQGRRCRWRRHRHPPHLASCR